MLSCTVAFAPSKMNSKSSVLNMESEPSMDDRRSFVSKTGSAAAAAAVATATGSVVAPQPAEAASQMWKNVELPFSDTIYDIDFDT